MENLKVAHDGTVRDASNRVVQFLYGDDGVDAVHIVRLPIPPLCEPWDLDDYSIDFKVLMALREERERAVDALAYLQEWSKEHQETLVSCPVDVAVLYERARMLSGPKVQHESLERILEAVQELLDVVDIHLFKQFLSLFLQTKNLIKLNTTFFQWFVETVQERFERSKIQAGEMVGVSSYY